ncbi:MAG: hypothetical protein ACXWUG_04800 [Polyangiales bacterium]
MKPRRLAVSIALTAVLHGSVAGTVLLAMPSVAYAQKGVPTQKLIDDAKSKFDDQQYDESIQKLSAALLRPDITKAQKIEVYRWLAYNYIVLKQDDSAKTAVYALLVLDETYELPKTESPKFREPFTKYSKQWVEDGKPGQQTEVKAPAPVTLKHSPAAEAPHDMSMSISGTIDDPEHRVAKISLFYRTGSSGKFIEVPTTNELGSFKVNIPGSAVKPPIVEYYIQASDKGGLAIASRGDAETPLRVAVQGEKEGSIFGTWWFWTGTGAVVAGGILAGVLLSKKNDNGGGGGGGNNSNFTVTISEPLFRR